MKYYTLLAISFQIILSHDVFGQHKTRDSLYRALKATTGEEQKAVVLLRLGTYFAPVNKDSAFYYNEEALKSATKAGDKLQIIRARIALWADYANRLGPEEGLANCITNDSLINIETGKASGEKLKELERYKVLNTSYTGTIYKGIADVDKALEYQLKAEEGFRAVGDKAFESKVLNKIGTLYSEKAMYPKALEYLFRSLKMQERLKDTTGMAMNYTQLGIVYYSMKESTKAKAYYTTARELYEKTNNYSDAAAQLVNLGIIYSQEGDNDKGMECLLKALEYFEKTANTNSIALTMMNIGAQYKDEGDTALARGKQELALKEKFPQALNYFLKAHTLLKELDFKQAICVIEGDIGITYYSLGNYVDGEKYMKRSLQLAQELGSLDDIKLGHRYLYELYNRTNQPQKALENYRLFIRYRDSIENTENVKAALQQELKFSFEKKAAADSVRAADEKKLITVQLRQEKTQRFALYGGLALVLVFSGFIFNRFRTTRKQKTIIEAKEKETQHQKELIEEKQKEILDSINYAKRIQQALLASEELLNKNLPEYFVLFQPKDIVSGDFYWASHIHGGQQSEPAAASAGDLFFLAACDSTGHGVPGAFMSLLNISFLNEAVTEKEILQPGEVLNHTRGRLIKALKTDGSEEGGKDGMDCTLICFERQTGRLKYAAANNDFYLIRNREVITLKADKMPVGKSPRDAEPFLTREVELIKGDQIYLFTDGLADQFGGPKGKKFKYRQLEEVLLAHADQPMSLQKTALEKAFENWKGILEQVDDVCIIGIRL